jgi:hypothetical protein
MAEALRCCLAGLVDTPGESANSDEIADTVTKAHTTRARESMKVGAVNARHIADIATTITQLALVQLIESPRMPTGIARDLICIMIAARR